ncbi:hypothetical protein ACWGH4_07255 [Streptomyces sp. NPDC054847]
MLRRYARVTWWPVRTEEEAVAYAERLGRIAVEQRASYHGGPHPDPCRCHECLSRA